MDAIVQQEAGGGGFRHFPFRYKSQRKLKANICSKKSWKGLEKKAIFIYLLLLLLYFFIDVEFNIMQQLLDFLFLMNFTTSF